MSRNEMQTKTVCEPATSRDEKLMHFDWLMRATEWVDLAVQLPEGVRWE